MVTRIPRFDGDIPQILHLLEYMPVACSKAFDSPSSSASTIDCPITRIYPVVLLNIRQFGRCWKMFVGNFPF